MGFGLADGFMMMGVAFVLERSGFVENSQTVADQDAAEVFSLFRSIGMIADDDRRPVPT